MAAKIKPDHLGSVLVHTPKGPVFLKAGDDVPAGVKVNKSLIVEGGGDNVKADKPRSRRASSGRAAKRGS